MVIFTTFKCESNSIPTQMIRITNYVPKTIGPSKLDKVLSYCVTLSDEGKEKVCIITDIARIGKALMNPPMSAENFYELYEMNIQILMAVQQAAQAELNTALYHRRVASNTGL